MTSVTVSDSQVTAVVVHDGVPGKPGASTVVSNAYIDENGSLILELSTGQLLNTGVVRGAFAIGKDEDGTPYLDEIDGGN